MKKNIILTILILLVSILTACGKSQENLSAEVSSSEETITLEIVDETAKETDTVSVKHKKSEFLPNTFLFPSPEIYIDVPSYNDIEKGCTQMYKDGEAKYVTFNCLFDHEAAGMGELWDTVYPKFKNNVSSWHRINTEEFTSMEEVEVNGIEAQKIIGTVEFGMKTMTDCYLYGYCFNFADVPCAIIGVVSDLSQPQEEIDELIAIVDAMMESVRTEP